MNVVSPEQAYQLFWNDMAIRAYAWAFGGLAVMAVSFLYAGYWAIRLAMRREGAAIVSAVGEAVARALSNRT